MIDREDMLELSRRMTPKRASVSRIAGAYMDEEGFVDGTFNTNFLKLGLKDKETHLAIAKTVPFAKTNDELKEYAFTKDSQEIYKLLLAIRACGLKNDALLDVFYEQIGEIYKAEGPYAILLFYGVYDVPVKFKDNTSYYESEDVFEYLIVTLGPVSDDYEAGLPDCGFLFPAFSDRAADMNRIDLYQKNTAISHEEILKFLHVK